MPDVLGKDRARYAGKTVAVLGAGHSAIGTLTDLGETRRTGAGTRPIWLLRGNDPPRPLAVAPTTSWPPAASSARPLPRWWRRADHGRKRIPGFASRADGPRLVVGAGSACCGRQVVRRRTDRGDGLPPRARFRARIAHPARSRRSNARSRWRR
jgi:hypothetical protein